MEANEILEKVSAMWGTMAAITADQAQEAAAGGNTLRAAELGRYAEAFYWRTSGENEAFDLSNERLP